ncbi:MAG TPA: alpha/beta fold hydrolase [Actinomycetota bacterium]
MEVRTATIHGSRVAYRAAGNGSAIVLIHGMAGSSETWEPVMPSLAACGTIIAPDLPGHGASAKPQGDYSLGALAAGIRDLLVTLGHDRATVVGHSLGGGVAMQFAYQFPERTQRLVLVSSGGLGREVSRLLRALALPGSEYVLAAACAPRIRGAGTAVQGWLGKLGLRPVPAASDVWRSYVSLGDPDARASFIHTLRAVIDVGGQRVSARDRLYLTAEMPAMIVWGDRDPFIPVAHAHAAHDAMPGSRLEIFGGAGHYPHCDDPEAFASLVSNFIASTPPADLDAGQVRDRMGNVP